MYVISALHADSPSAQGRGTRREAEASRAQSPLPGRMTAPLGVKTGPSPSGTSHSPTGSVHNGEGGPLGSCHPRGMRLPCSGSWWEETAWGYVTPTPAWI